MIAFSTIQTFGAALGAFGGGDVSSAGGGLAVALTGSVIAPRMAAKLITNPRFIKWLTTPITNPSKINAHLGRLWAIGKAEPAIKEEIEQYIQALRPSPEPSPEGAALADPKDQPENLQIISTPIMSAGIRG